jgi:hypothetical protein
MLHYNRAARGAHLTHAAVLALHAFCCGLPVLAVTAAALTGVAAGSAVMPEAWLSFHGALHGNELAILVLSGVLVAVGAALELSARKSGGGQFPLLFLISAGCFLANAGILLVHRGV